MHIALLAAFVLGVAGAQAQRPIPLPAGLPPQVCLATAAIENGILVLHIITPQLVPEQRERKVLRDGKEVVEKIITYVPVSREQTFRVDGKQLRVMTKAGKDVDRQAILNALIKTTPVIVSFDGPVDPFYLAVVRDDVLIVTQERAPAKGK